MVSVTNVLAFTVIFTCCVFESRAQDFTCDDMEATAPYLTRRRDVFVTSYSSNDDVDGTVVNQQDGARYHEDSPGVQAGEHDLIIGDCVGADIYDKYNFTDCTFPGTGNQTRYYNVRYNGNVEIYCIQVLDKMGVNGTGYETGGYAFIEQGGIGFDLVEIKLVSQPNEGLKYLMEIYTRVLENTWPPSSTTARH